MPVEPTPFERHADLFVLTNRIGGQQLKAECQVWGTAHDWEVRLHIVGRRVVGTLAVPTVPAAMATGVRWKAAMMARGWRE